MSDELSWLEDVVPEFSCDLDEAKMKQRSAEQQSLARSYSVKCVTNRQWWDALHAACVPLQPRPSECWDDEYKLLNVDQYVERITHALTSSSAPVERFNLVVEAVGLATAHVVYEWPRRRIERRISEAFDEYLPASSLEDAQTVILLLQESFLGLPNASQRAVRKYARKTPGLSDKERESLRKTSRMRWVEGNAQGTTP